MSDLSSSVTTHVPARQKRRLRLRVRRNGEIREVVLPYPQNNREWVKVGRRAYRLFAEMPASGKG
jgi:hypothetical protein